MTIVGLGIDATDISRIAQAIDRYGERFLSRILTERELAYCLARRNPAPHVAGRFAAKEAGMKAIGTGHSGGVLWRDVEVIRRGGPPQLQFHNAAARHFSALGAERAFLTITHATDLAIAHVILVGRDPGA
jgi:holo-[acyl-carrier protein] synthase